MELMYQTLFLLRTRYHFNGYIHVKAIPYAPDDLLEQVGYLADRMSVNLELPTAEGLAMLAPQKTRASILTPMRRMQQRISGYRLAIGKKCLYGAQYRQPIPGTQHFFRNTAIGWFIGRNFYTECPDTGDSACIRKT